MYTKGILYEYLLLNVELTLISLRKALRFTMLSCITTKTRPKFQRGIDGQDYNYIGYHTVHK